MNRLLSLFCGLLVLGAAWGPAALAQQGPGMGQRLFEAARVDTLAGVVVRMDTTDARPGHRHRGVHVQVAASGDTLTVHMGPLFYLRRQGVSLRAGDALTVRGARVTLQGAPAMIAAEVQAHGQSWTLRDAQGRPAWAGQRRGGS